MAETIGSVAARTVAVAAKTNTIALKTDGIAARTEAIERRLEEFAASVDERLTVIAEGFARVETHLLDLRAQVAKEGENTHPYVDGPRTPATVSGGVDAQASPPVMTRISGHALFDRR